MQNMTLKTLIRKLSNISILKNGNASTMMCTRNNLIIMITDIQVWKLDKHSKIDLKIRFLTRFLASSLLKHVSNLLELGALIFKLHQETTRNDRNLLKKATKSRKTVQKQ